MNKEELKQSITKEYLNNTKNSKAHFEKATQYIPGGVSRLTNFFSPYPFFVSRGEGSRFYDVDGNEYIDFLNNYAAGILGHNHPAIVDAARSQSKNINSSAPVTTQYEYAELLCNRVPSMDSVRFCTSGSEAGMHLMQLARFFTGKNCFIKIDGGYHGGSDYAEINSMPDMEADGKPDVIPSHGVSPGAAKDIFVTPFNDVQGMEDILKQHSQKIAGIIMEPLLGRGGYIMPQKGYLESVRELADTYDVLLIFDEVVSFRLHKGGMQAMHNVIPDLTMLGKVIGGGLPVGAYGGRKEILELSDPLTQPADHLLWLSGTFSAHPMTMAAGLACMEIYNESEISRLNGLGETLRKGLESVLKDAGIQGQCNGFGSLLRLVFTDNELNTAKDVMTATMKKLEFSTHLQLDMLNQGVFFSPYGIITLSTPMGEDEINKFINAFGNSIEKVRPLY